MNLLKLLYIFLGTLSLAIGIIGVFVPGLPTTPFLLITAGLYIRSSEKLYNKLISNRYVGHYITDWQKNKGFTIQKKLYIILLMWTMISISCYFFISATLWDIIVISLGGIGTVTVGFILPTIKNKT